MRKIRPEGQLQVILAQVAGQRALDDCDRAGDTTRHAEVSRRLEETYAEVRRHCAPYELPLPAGVPDE